MDDDFSYDAASRLQTVAEGTFSATYSYLANSPLISQIQFKSNTTVRLTTTKQYDNLNRLLNINSQPSASGASSFASSYLHNDANQRIRNDKADGSAWSYEYDPLGHALDRRVLLAHGFRKLPHPLPAVDAGDAGESGQPVG